MTSEHICQRNPFLGSFELPLCQYCGNSQREPLLPFIGLAWCVSLPRLAFPVLVALMTPSNPWRPPVKVGPKWWSISNDADDRGRTQPWIKGLERCQRFVSASHLSAAFSLSNLSRSFLLRSTSQRTALFSWGMSLKFWDTLRKMAFVTRLNFTCFISNQKGML